MTAEELLRKVRAYYTGPKRWTQKVYARDAVGYEVSRKNETKVASLCIQGGLMKFSSATDRPWIDACEYLGLAIAQIYPERMCHSSGIVDFNDHPDTTFADVIAVIDRAIVLAGQEQSA